MNFFYDNGNKKCLSLIELFVVNYLNHQAVLSLSC